MSTAPAGYPFRSKEQHETEFARLLRAERLLVAVRAILVVFGSLQVLTFYLPYPPRIMEFAWAVVAFMTLGNLAFYFLLRRQWTQTQLRSLAVVSLTFDLLIAQGFTFTYTFDPNTAIWAVIYILPLGGAIRFQRKGALAITAAATVLYTAREVFGYYHYNNEFLAASITFRMGIAFIIAIVAGTTTKQLLQGRKEVEVVNRELSEMNQAMRDFVSIASHDMRTPLSVVSGLSQTLANDHGALNEQQRRELIEVIHRRSQSLDRLVNDLLTTSNIEAGTVVRHPEALDALAAVQDAVDITDSSGVIIEAVPAMLFADAEHVRRILVNFLNNARRYGRPPITVRISTAVAQVHIEISDCGDGVPDTFTPRLFEKFARAPGEQNRTEGTGLGLAIVRGLAEVNGGTVTYSPNKPTGATFCLCLPAFDEGPT